MSFSTTTRAAFVNRSSITFNVYDNLVYSTVHAGGITAGGNVIGKIYPDECYTVIPADSYTISSCEIIFRDNNGDEAHGYIETSEGITLDDYAWVKYQEPYHYYNSNGSKLVDAATEKIDGKTYYVFTVKKPVKYRNNKGTSMGTLEAGTKLATLSSTTGETYGSHMIFYKKKTGSTWTDLCPSSSAKYGFVDLGFDVGSKATNRAIF